MMAALTTPREGVKVAKTVLGVGNLHYPLIETTLAALTFNPSNIDDVRRFGNQLYRDAEAWMRRGGFKERPQRLRKWEADKALKAELQKLAGVSDV